MTPSTAPSAPQDPAILRVFGATPDEARTRLQTELDAFEAHLRTRQADWTHRQPGREWTPAQEAEHVMLVNSNISKLLGLLMSDKELRPVPQVPGVLKDGKRVAPAFSVPSDTGLAWADLASRWAAHREQLLKAAQAVQATPDRTFWHLYYGELDALDWLRMVTGHLRGHRKLLEQSAAAQADH